HPRAHRGIVLGEKALVVVRLVNRPRYDNAGITPRRSGISYEHTRRYVGERARRRLSIADILEPLRHERRYIAIECRRRREDLGVAHPAKSLVALRAVGWNTQIVSAHTPIDIVLELIHHLVRTFERAGCIKGGADDDTFDRAFIRLARITGYLYITES